MVRSWVLGAAIGLATVGGGLEGCVQPSDPKGEAASPLLHAPALETAPIDVARAAKDPDELGRALTRRHRDSAGKLGAHRVVMTASSAVTEPGAAADAPADLLGEEAHLDVDAAGAFHALYTNSHDVGREMFFVAGWMWIRPRYGKFHHRLPAADDEAARTADEIYATFGADYDLVARFAALHDDGPVTQDGRAARKVTISLGPPREVKVAHTGEQAWRDHVTVRALDGEVVLDVATGTVLAGTLKADVVFNRDGHDFEMVLSANHAVTRDRQGDRGDPARRHRRRTDSRPPRRVRGSQGPPRRPRVAATALARACRGIHARTNGADAGEESCAMNTGLVRKNEHLTLHRRLILLRSLAAGAAGMVPIPYIDDWIPAVLQRSTLRRLADSRRVDVDEDAVRVIADGTVAAPTWRTAAAAAPFARFLRRSWRRVLISLVAYRRAEEAGRLFAMATMFDHYCARLHVGAGLDLAGGRALRARMDAAMARMPRGLLASIFRSGLIGAGRAALAVPVEIVRSLTGRRRKGPPADETQLEEIVDGAVVRVGGGVLARAVKAVETELGGAGRQYIDALLDAFEATEQP